MNYAEYKARNEAAAEAWMEEHAAELDAIIEVGQDTGLPIANPRPQSDKRLMRDSLTNQVRQRDTIAATETSFETSRLPSSDLSGVDPESLGLYAAGRRESAMADKARAHHCIEFVLDSDGKVRGGKSGKTRETKAEKRARLANRYAK